MIDITHEDVEKFLLETEFDHNPGQKEISFPVIKRIHRRLQQGNSFSAIKVTDGRIVDGHHRYICHKLLNRNPKTTHGGANSTNKEYAWAEINLAHIDYDTDETKRIFEERYDKQ
jgi:hypothetical protein